VYSWTHTVDDSQEIPILQIEEKISDACLSVLIFLCVCAIQ